MPCYPKTKKNPTVHGHGAVKDAVSDNTVTERCNVIRVCRCYPRITHHCRYALVIRFRVSQRFRVGGKPSNPPFRITRRRGVLCYPRITGLYPDNHVARVCCYPRITARSPPIMLLSGQIKPYIPCNLSTIHGTNPINVCP